LNKRKEESKSSFSFLLVTIFFSFSKRKEKCGKKKLEEKFGYSSMLGKNSGAKILRTSAQIFHFFKLSKL
jgi:hypothetical protein